MFQGTKNMGSCYGISGRNLGWGGEEERVREREREREREMKMTH